VLTVLLSVRPSVSPVYCVKTAELLCVRESRRPAFQVSNVSATLQRNHWKQGQTCVIFDHVNAISMNISIIPYSVDFEYFVMLKKRNPYSSFSSLFCCFLSKSLHW